MTKLKGKTVLITGGASGIGLASAKRFVAEGAVVYISGRRKDVIESAVKEIGGSVRGLQADITNPEDLDRVFETIRTERQTLDVLFANAGVGELVHLGEITSKHFDYTFDINVKGTVFTVQKALPLLKPGSSIILTGSTTGVMGTPAMSIYSASKAAVRNLARSWAQDLRGTSIRVNVLSPGPTKTDKIAELLNPEIIEGLSNGTALERMGEPTEVAAVAAFLASDDSSFMTGSEVFVDGGYAQI
ncbi:SDR family oxidoreductase [Thalassospira sp. ER-Se-21-Dark]|uniref:SDR family NAD(P)-dependent oxidoreductase n=1 Tax=Thalassospira sp. ER-Se-21-Dark TaxID=2585190 RepID=UPI001B3024BF|nr:SDR family oxidoreductase [Thalassospira sp. ER-Se-21-Dark]MBP3126988.1 SDR family oxidoreductase [Thalassospira sp. ER-Se-21-Dark]